MNLALHPNQLRPGDRVREYRLLRRLGVGGFSMVFLAEHEGAHYALKMALQPASDADEDHVDGWIRREALSLEHLEHPNLLPVHELGRWPQPRTGYSFYVTDYIPGVTFLEWCRSDGVTPYQWVGVLCEALRPLEAMHGRGICHRDFKADNILVRQEDARPFVIDFGAVHMPCARPLTEGLAPGTLYCQPPEAVHFVVGQEVLVKGSRFEARPSADLYAVGVVLYEALTGHHPFDPKLPVDQLLVAILSVTPADPQRLNPQAPVSLCALAMRLLAKEPSQRPSSARAVREELERLRANEEETPAWRISCGLGPGKREPSQGPGTPEPKHEGSIPVPKGVLTAAVHTRRSGGRRRILWVLGSVLIGLVGWMLLAPASPTHFGLGAPVQSLRDDETSSAPPSVTEAPSRACSLLKSVLGLAVAQLVGCATTPVVRPDPVGYLHRCPLEARATPKKLGFAKHDGYYYASYITDSPTVSRASSQTLEEGSAINVKPGPIAALVFPFNTDERFRMEGVAVTTKWRVYIQFDRMQLHDGSWVPICGVAVSTGEDIYGIPTRAGLVLPDSPVDPAMVDHSSGTALLNDPQFMTAIESTEGTLHNDLKQVDVDEKPDNEIWGL